LKSTTAGSLKDHLAIEGNQKRFGFSMVKKSSISIKGEA